MLLQGSHSFIYEREIRSDLHLSLSLVTPALIVHASSPSEEISSLVAERRRGNKAHCSELVMLDGRAWMQVKMNILKAHTLLKAHALLLPFSLR